MMNQYNLESASALPFLEPGLYVTVNEKREKNRGPASLAGVEAFGWADVLQVAVIGEYNEGVLWAF